MNLEGFPILTAVTFFPLAGAILLFFVPKAKEEFIKWMTLVISLVEFVISLPLFIYFNEGMAGMQFVERIPWIPEWGVSYFIGVDGISLLLILLTTFLTVLCILSSWRSVERMVKEYMIVFLILETGMIGVLSPLISSSSTSSGRLP
jgi:NADH-quinone oxidoreductase subunit M